MSYYMTNLTDSSVCWTRSGQNNTRFHTPAPVKYKITLADEQLLSENGEIEITGRHSVFNSEDFPGEEK